MSPSNDAGASTLPPSIAFSAPASFPYLQDSLRSPRQAVDLPSQDEIEDEACEIAARAYHRGGIDYLENCRYETNHPEHHAHPAKALAKGRGPEHGHPEGNETYRHDKEPYVENRIVYAPDRLPQEGECRLIPGGRTRSVIEVGERGVSDMRESSDHEHGETQNAQDAPEESGREARPPESPIQGKEEGDLQDDSHQVYAILYYAGRSDVGEPRDPPREVGRIPHSRGTREYYDPGENEEDATQHTGQTTPSQNAFLLLHHL